MASSIPCKAQADNTPFQLHKRAMPQGKNFDKLFPAKIGNFSRTHFQHPKPGFDGEARYENGSAKLFMQFGLAKDYNETQGMLRIMVKEAESPEVTEKKKVLKKDPSYVRFVSKDGIFFGWTRGFYYFSAECKSVSDFEFFMADFPF
ncbi:MAG: hypothetical protein H7Y04_11500 [Verrucomicrobia bacterium]|nr:hypothetical protein [Cytophagales bacterium]